MPNMPKIAQAQVSDIPIGFNARLFPNNWRPALNEIDFGAQHEFAALQFPGREEGTNEAFLGATFAEVRQALNATQIIPVMEIVARLGLDGRTQGGLTPMDLLRNNLSAILGLGCTCVHWHMVVPLETTDAQASAFEHARISEFAAGVGLAQQHNFKFGIEHNETSWHPFKSPAACAYLLDAVPGLHFVWDLNHTVPEALADYLALTPRMSMLHVSDTPLPTINHHLPIGLGNIDFGYYFAELRRRGFSGPAILEIGGLPKSGGYGRDTDEALVNSLKQLRQQTTL